MDFKNWPKWVKDMLPEDLFNAYGNIQAKEVKSSGRKSAINNDNVNDLSYYYFKKRKQDINKPLKGTDKTPLDYAYEKSKIKCFCFLYKDNFYSKERAKELKSLYDKYKDDEKYKWFKYFCILNATPEMFKPDEVYDFILNSSSPYENLLIVVNRYRSIEATEVLQVRNNKNIEKDTEFFNRLNKNQKMEVLRIVRIEKFQFEVERALSWEQDLEVYFTHKLSTLSVIIHASENRLIKEFQQFIDSYQHLFENFRNFKIIHPNYQSLYPIAFKNQSWDKFLEARENEHSSELYNRRYEIEDYITKKLIPNKCLDEIKFFMEKKYYFDSWHIAEVLKTLDFKMINFIKKEVPQEDFIKAQDHLLYEGHECIEKFIKLGYHPSMRAIGSALGNKECRFSNNFDLIERFIPSNEKLDDVKRKLARYNIDILPEFLSKYSDRLESMDIDSFDLQHNNKNYQRLCEILGVEYVKSESESESSSSSSYKYRRSKSRPQTSNKPKKEKTKPYKICTKCAQQNICMACGKSYKFHNGTSAYVCESHCPKLGSKCPLCNKGSPSTPAMICSRCQVKYKTFECFKCKK